VHNAVRIPTERNNVFTEQQIKQGEDRAMKVLVIGGGIGGFATALSLHAVGIGCQVFEQSHPIRELGVGINILPHAVKELAELGLLDALDRVAIRTSELIYTNRFGQQLWREPRGLDAGYDYPQFSIHRGKLQGVLYEAARARIGEDNIRTAHQLHGVALDAHGVTATFTRRDGSDEAVTARGDVLIAADGIHSTVRRLFYPDEGPPRWNGIMIWRGAVAYPPFLTGRSMLIAGGMRAKLVLYPIAHETSTPGTNLLNWGVTAKLGDGSRRPPRREDWNRLGRLEELLPHVAGVFQLPSVDPVDVIRTTVEVYEYPMCDRDPLPRWSFGRVTLLGDAAHPMYPVGSNGASQAILDARCVAPLLAETNDVVSALKAYEAARLSATTKIVLDNRAGGPERVIDLVEERAPDGFADLDEVASHAELEAIVKGYSKMAGFDQTQVNRSKQVGMLDASRPGAS
jgi:2-polyprenyl-6-methoxyphenol hydroxylase-like FAD-dependent oxidoreductase